jgi:capsular polysaccharide biosynthesis protein
MLDWLRRQATTRLPKIGSRARRLYISRADAQQRRVINEDEIRSELTRRGFDILVPSATSFREQVSLCASAAWIVGPHGAGLTNAVFAAPGATLIEFHPADEMNHVFWLQASASGQRYGMVSGDVVNPRRDQFVPLPALIELLERCGCAS